MNTATGMIDRLLGDGAHGRLGFLARIGLPGAALLAGGWMLAYASGVAPWLGTESRTVRLHAISTSGSGYEFGVSRFLFLEGQTIVVEYDLKERRAGWLQIAVRPPFGRHEAFEWVKTRGRGRLNVPVTRTGLYAIDLRGYPAGGEDYDLTYSARWGAVFGPAERRPRFRVATH